MSQRLEAAVKAWDHYWGDRYGDEALEEMGEEVQVALDAADSVMFSDEAIDAAAKKLYARGNPNGNWDEHTLAVQNIYRNEIKFLIATLKENA